MIATAAMIIFVYFMALFIAGTAAKNNSIADIGWGPGFVLVAWILLLGNLANSLALFIMTLMITLWGARLYLHISKRNTGKPEDFRYKGFRKAWGKWVVPRAFLQIYMLQGLFMFIISLPVILKPETTNPVSLPVLLIGLLVFAIGFLFETIGDRQLAAFKQSPESKGKLMTHGLWKYTRHPNYFGESAIWWGVFIVALSGGGTVFSVLSPITITLLLLYVSGVPMLEHTMMKREGYAAYAARTSKFFPWFPKPAPHTEPLDNETEEEKA